MQIVWAKAGHGIWGLGHVFEGTSPQMLLMTVLSQGIRRVLYFFLDADYFF